MKKNLLSLSLLLIIVLTACAQSKKAGTNGAPKTEYVRMERTACFGTCPNYAIEVYKSGIVRYTGIRFTEHEGIYEKNFGKEKTTPILKKFDEYRVDTCQDEYPQMIADLPGIIYNLQYANGKEKRIYQAHFGPDFLKELAAEVDKLGDVGIGWKKVEDTQHQ